MEKVIIIKKRLFKSGPPESRSELGLFVVVSFEADTALGRHILRSGRRQRIARPFAIRRRHRRQLFEALDVVKHDLGASASRRDDVALVETSLHFSIGIGRLRYETVFGRLRVGNVSGVSQFGDRFAILVERLQNRAERDRIRGSMLQPAFAGRSGTAMTNVSGGHTLMKRLSSC